VVACKDMLDNTDMDMLDYPKHHSLGKVRKGALLCDITMQSLRIDQHIRSPQTLCEKHKAAEHHSISRQAFLHYLVARVENYSVQISQ
jgi:hypothetical protein